jgi:hypothetical protein
MNNSFKIEQNVPLPAIPRGAPPSPIKYPWSELNVGDSFFVPLVDKNIMAIRTAIILDLKKFSTQTGQKIKITTRAIDNGVRVWRIK